MIADPHGYAAEDALYLVEGPLCPFCEIVRADCICDEPDEDDRED